MSNSKPMTTKQISAVFKRAPRYSQFTIVIGQQVRERWDSKKMVWVRSKPVRILSRDHARKFAKENVIFEITYSVVRPVKRPDVATVLGFGGSLD